MVVFPSLLFAISVAAWYGRWHLLVHSPERYEEFHRAEREFAKAAVAGTERAVRGLVGAIKGMGRLLSNRKV